MNIMLLAAVASDKALLGSEVLLTSEVRGSLVRQSDAKNAAPNISGDCRHLSEPILDGPDGFPLAL